MNNVFSPYIMTVIVSWVVAQGAKYAIAAIKGKSIGVFRQLYLSGNMPSAHTAAVISLCIMVGLRDGTNGPLFGIAALFAGIVMYDAVMVRRSVGEQGAALTEIIQKMNKGMVLPRAARGHTPAEVLVGAGLGVAIGFTMFFVFK